MSNVGWSDLLYLFLLLIPLLFLQRFLQHEIQAIFLLLTHQPEMSMALFSLLFLPGVFLHEISHFIMANVLGVRTGRFSLIPRKVGGGRIQLGYVETAPTDFVRDALIGAAPLIAGGIFIAYVGINSLELNKLWDSISRGSANTILPVIQSIVAVPDFWLWFYLIFTISSTMMPSSSDRRAWLPLILIITMLAGLVLLFGAGPWVSSHLGSIIRSALDTIVIIFGTTVLIHLTLLPPTLLLRKLISRISGYQVV